MCSEKAFFSCDVFLLSVSSVVTCFRIDGLFDSHITPHHNVLFVGGV